MIQLAVYLSHAVVAISYAWMLARLMVGIGEQLATGYVAVATPLIGFMALFCLAILAGLFRGFTTWRATQRTKALVVAGTAGTIGSWTLLLPLVMSDYAPVVAGIAGPVAVVALVTASRGRRLNGPLG